MSSKKQNLSLRHLAIIMDGNRRWAKQRGLSPFMGHKRGYEVFQKIAQACLDRGIKILTVYAFSTENWKRSRKEVSLLMNLLERGLKEQAKKLQEYNIRLNILGRIEDLPQSLQRVVLDVVDKTKKNTGGILNLALSYGGRAEIISAVRKILKTKKDIDEINEREFSQFLYTAGQPDPDLIIRTGERLRISNFLLWQGAYSELYFTDTLWPDFTEKELDKALADYKTRQRNFGK